MPLTEDVDGVPYTVASIKGIKEKKIGIKYFVFLNLSNLYKSYIKNGNKTIEVNLLTIAIQNINNKFSS